MVQSYAVTNNCKASTDQHGFSRTNSSSWFIRDVRVGPWPPSRQSVLIQNHDHLK